MNKISIMEIAKTMPFRLTGLVIGGVPWVLFVDDPLKLAVLIFQLVGMSMAILSAVAVYRDFKKADYLDSTDT